ncbi:MAG: hypothetical protein KGL10_00235 [Alphaproteobacteria bacterium]|nr:hypothetical protein [Alphaproteobacteria bacterium]MDE2335719.1 hypothetical protein [Alphaproteobacteria bacterium]
MPAGAQEKIENARRMREAGHFNVDIHGKNIGSDTPYPSQTIPVTLIYAVAIIISMIVSDNGANPLSGMHLTGIHDIDNFVTGTGNTAFTGDPNEDHLISIFARGTAFFLLAGAAPLAAALLEHLLFKKRVMPLILCWGVIITAMLFYFFGVGVVSFFKSF